MANIKMRAVFITAFILLISNNGFAQLSEYPDWFLFPEQNSGFYTGFSFRGYRAVDDAEVKYVAYNNCIIDGVLRIITKEDIYFPYRSTGYFYYYSENALEDIKGRLKPVDSVVTNSILQQSIVLYAMDSTVKISKKRIKTVKLNRPEWVKGNIYKSDDYYYSVGKFSSKGNENDSWRTAEERAIFRAVLSTDYNLSVEESYDDNKHKAEKYLEITDITVKKALYQIEVLERYPDVDKKLNYVLIRLKIKP